MPNHGDQMLRTDSLSNGLAVGNRLLAQLGEQDRRHVLTRLERVPLTLKSVILAQDKPVGAVYFPENGSVSMITTLDDGARVEVGLVGREGFVGLPLLLGAPTATIEGMVQIEGTALRLSAARFRGLLDEVPALSQLLMRYVDSFAAQLMQTVACNSRHRIAQRLCRWILMSHDRVDGDCFPMTQEFIATMLGVRRPGVTLAVGALQRAGLIVHRKGMVRVLDRPGLEAASCECYAAIQTRFAWMTGAGDGPSSTTNNRR